MKKELFIFSLLFSFLTLGMHMPQWIDHPLIHFHNLANHKMPYHPLIFTFVVYVIIGLIRTFIYGIKKLFTRRHDSL